MAVKLNKTMTWVEAHIKADEVAIPQRVVEEALQRVARAQLRSCIEELRRKGLGDVADEWEKELT